MVLRRAGSNERSNMKISKHAKVRMTQRGISQKFVEFALFFLPSKYENQSNKIFLSSKLAKALAGEFRKWANTLEKHSGTELLLDPMDSSLITAYRKTSRK